MSEPRLAAAVATPMIVRSSLLLPALVACRESPDANAAAETSPRVEASSDRAARFVVSVAVQEQSFDLFGSAMLSTDADAADAAPVWEYDYYQSGLYRCGGQWFSAWVEVHPLGPGGPSGSYDIDLRLEYQASLTSQPVRWSDRKQCDLRGACKLEGGGFTMQIKPRPNTTQQPTGAPSGAGG